MPSTDDIGTRGEAIFIVRITDPSGPGREPYFRPHFLGEKFPTLDYLVELVGLTGRMAFFFVQVKTTRQGLTRKPPARLKIKVEQADVDRMVVYPAPTYVVGIDERNEQAYIASVNRAGHQGMSSLLTIHPMNASNLQLLWKEVERYWRRKDMVLKTSSFET
jgi:hypothetical protein